MATAQNGFEVLVDGVAQGGRYATREEAEQAMAAARAGQKDNRIVTTIREVSPQVSAATPGQPAAPLPGHVQHASATQRK